jgi:signal-transduction protein with cAMP-binding, CBS, and nucleotidyltransferase domain
MTQAASPASLLLGPIAGAMAPPPPALPPEVRVSAAVAAMEAARCSAVLAVDAAGRPVGILTEQDVTRRVAFRLPPEAPLSAAMTAPVIACGAAAGLWRAVALLRAHQLRHLPVLGADGRCIGLLHRAETLAAASGRLLGHLDALGESGEDDAALKRAQSGVAAALLAEGVPAPEVVALVSEINLDLHRRVAARAMAAQGAPPPVPFTLLVMGSAGRSESLLRPDQDNGLILGDYDDADHNAVDAWFRGFADAWNEGLAAAGFPLCLGGVMARNPLWRKRLSEWQTQFGLWAARRSGAARLFADIAFDFRGVAEGDAGGITVPAGTPPAVAALRTHLARVLAAHPALLAALAEQDAGLRVGLTFWGGFADDAPGPEHRTDLKLHGLMPLVAAARLAALRRGVAETGTLARIAGIAAAGEIGAAEAARLRDAFALLLEAVLRQQLADQAAGLVPGQLVDTGALGRAERARLRDALRAVRGFASTVFAGLTGRVW